MWIHDESLLIKDAEGKPKERIGFWLDISERKKLDMALLQAKDQAEQANKTKSNFLSSMSHELRTPLNAILGFAQIMNYDAKDEEAKESLEEIMNAGKYLLSLINDVLDLEKIESGSLSMSCGYYDLASMVRECTQTIKPLADARHINIVDDISNNDQHQVYVDNVRFKQVMLNILSNAIKYNHESGSVWLTTKQQHPGWLRVSVVDNGRGIDSTQMHRLFTPFDRIGAESGVIEGTGIGLVITQRLVHMMGGEIGVESDLGKGTKIWLDIACAVESASIYPADPEPAVTID